MTDEEMKLECLKLAHGMGHPSRVIEAAEVYWSFIKSENSTKVIDAASLFKPNGPYSL